MVFRKDIKHTSGERERGRETERKEESDRGREEDRDKESGRTGVVKRMTAWRKCKKRGNK